MRRVTIFGATGSVGQSALDLIARTPDKYDVVALTGGRNIKQLAKDAIALKADIAITCHADLHNDLKYLLAGTDVEVGSGDTAIAEVAHRPVDWTLSAIVGVAGLIPGLKALEQGQTLALANKESLVTAGSLMMETASSFDATILPVDSEHSAVFQALVGEDIKTVERIIITASGGALRDFTLEELTRVTLAQASSHPNWAMGQRITIDSASMFNKGMEIIETKEFFGINPDKIEVLVHRESLIHALVGFTDGALIAHIGPPDMRHAIGYALHWPDRGHVPVKRLDLAKIGSLNFENPDPIRFPALRLAAEVMNMGGLAGAVFNAAKEHALDLFIDGRIRFLDMAHLVEMTIDKMLIREGLQNAQMTLDNIIEVDALARVRANEVAVKLG